METLLAGGILMIPLGLCAVLSLAFILERAWVLSRIPDEQAAQQTLEEAERALADRGQEAAAQYCADHKGPLCFIFASLLKRFDISHARTPRIPSDQRAPSPSWPDRPVPATSPAFCSSKRNFPTSRTSSCWRRTKPARSI